MSLPGCDLGGSYVYGRLRPSRCSAVAVTVAVDSHKTVATDTSGCHGCPLFSARSGTERGTSATSIAISCARRSRACCRQCRGNTDYCLLREIMAATNRLIAAMTHATTSARRAVPSSICHCPTTSKIVAIVLINPPAA